MVEKYLVKMAKLLAQGAEAKIFKDNNSIIKERFSKEYRLEHLDHALRQFRTRREAKVLGKLADINFPAPHLQNFSDKRMSIVMDFVPGEKLKDVLLRGDECGRFAQEMGEKIGKLHAENIIHGDLTTSNLILHEQTKELNFIDFGLSSFSDKIEDKAVDLFLLERSLQSTHYDKPEMFEKIVESYRESSPQAAEVLERLQAVQKRGRNKAKE
ncbi:Kae1-associated kinase Bud32 [Candidatus Woesearchaeota archaeon CG10_big_fil_rev_8_21_14_0_10_45_16]|nr:MAG: Kae1-associated kinase Bud32 [Candidatus Woesearchaeota archaeon CG10_big_fil_rev_8_21_14_0_10_45_16]